jgi:hypothetical protein
MSDPRPPLAAFTPAERRLVRRLTAPLLVQRFLNRLPYNAERPPVGETLRSFRRVVELRTAHCLEAALFAAVTLEQHGFPPLLLSFESVDKLDHVLFVYREDGRWGSVARSRDPGLHGRLPVFRTPRDLALSYVDPYVDFTGAITAYAVVDLYALGRYDWRFAVTNMWKVEQYLIDYPHRPIRISRARIDRLRARYERHMATHDHVKPIYYGRQDRWTELPAQYRGDPSRGRSRAWGR